MCDIPPGGGRARPRMPRHPQCFETDARPSTTRGPTGFIDPTDSSSDPRQVERRRRWNRSLQEAGINEAIQRIHGALLFEAGRMSASMSYERFTNLDSDPSIARRILDSVLQSTLDSVRDAALSRMLPAFFMRLLGSPLTYLTGLQSAYDQSQWDQRNASQRSAYRTQKVYARLLWVYASSAADGNLAQAVEYNAILVEQGLRYLRWRNDQLPRFQSWERQTFSASELGPSIGLPTTGAWNR